MPRTQHLGTYAVHLKQPEGHHHGNRHKEGVPDEGYNPQREPEVIHNNKKTRDTK